MTNVFTIVRRVIRILNFVANAFIIVLWRLAAALSSTAVRTAGLMRVIAQITV